MINNNALKTLNVSFKKPQKTCVNWCYKMIVKIDYNVKKVFLDMQKFYKTLQNL